MLCLYLTTDWLHAMLKKHKKEKKRWRFDQFQYQINKYLMHYHGSKSQKNCCRHWENLQLYSLRNILSQMVLILVHKKLIWHIHIILINEKWKKPESSNINYQLVHKLINLQSLWGSKVECAGRWHGEMYWTEWHDSITLINCFRSIN